MSDFDVPFGDPSGGRRRRHASTPPPGPYPPSYPHQPGPEQHGYPPMEPHGYPPVDPHGYPAHDPYAPYQHPGVDPYGHPGADPYGADPHGYPGADPHQGYPAGDPHGYHHGDVAHAYPQPAPGVYRAGSPIPGYEDDDDDATRSIRRPDTSSSRKKKRKKKRGGARSAVVFLVVVVILGGLGFGGWTAVNWVLGAGAPEDYSGPGGEPVVIEVLPGQTATQIAQTLYEADVIASAEAFIQAALANPQSVNIQPGRYEMRRQMSAAAALEILLDPANRIVERVTIPEGLSKFRTYALLSEELGIPVEEFEAAEKEVLELIPNEWFVRDDGKQAEGGIEGFLFPDTYEFGTDPTAEQVLTIMVNRFLEVADEINFVEVVKNDRNISPYVALIAASIAQAEAGTEEDLAKVARTAYNRVYRAFMPLEMDVTYNYGRELQGLDPLHSGEMRGDDLRDPANRYSTHAHAGWPPGPINSPGRAALEAAMRPADGPWLFFVLINPDTGESAFAATYDEHLANIRTACQNGVPLSDC